MDALPCLLSGLCSLRNPGRVTQYR